MQRSPTEKSKLNLHPDAEKVTAAQRRKLKQLHWDRHKVAAEGTVWKLDKDMPLDYNALEALFQIMENNTLKKKAGLKADAEIRLVEHRRAHNICIELSGVRKPLADIKDALLNMDDSSLTVEQLTALSHAVPEDNERKELDLYLAGEHPKHKGISEVERLGTVERYFVEIKDIPRLRERIKCFIFVRTYSSTKAKIEELLDLIQTSSTELKDCSLFVDVLHLVRKTGNHLNEGTVRGSAAGFKLDALLKLADMKGVDRKTSLLHFVVKQRWSADPTIKELPKQLAHVRQAANIQLSAIKLMLGELRLGLRGVNTEVVQAAKTKERENSGSKAFSELMAGFHSQACDEFLALESREQEMHDSLKTVTEFFGEDYIKTDPSRIIRVVRDFVLIFEKVLKDIKDEEDKAAAEEKKKKQAEEARVQAAKAKEAKANAAKAKKSKKKASKAAKAQGSSKESGASRNSLEHKPSKESAEGGSCKPALQLAEPSQLPKAGTVDSQEGQHPAAAAGPAGSADDAQHGTLQHAENAPCQPAPASAGPSDGLPGDAATQPAAGGEAITAGGDVHTNQQSSEAAGREPTACGAVTAVGASGQENDLRAVQGEGRASAIPCAQRDVLSQLDTNLPPSAPDDSEAETPPGLLAAVMRMATPTFSLKGVASFFASAAGSPSVLSSASSAASKSATGTPKEHAAVAESLQWPVQEAASTSKGGAEEAVGRRVSYSMLPTTASMDQAVFAATLALRQEADSSTRPAAQLEQVEESPSPVKQDNACIAPVGQLAGDSDLGISEMLSVL